MIGSGLLFIYLLYPAQSHALIICTVDSPDTWYDYFRSVLEAFEKISPGCTDGMAASIPNNWSRGKTVYFYSFFGFFKADITASIRLLGYLGKPPLHRIMHDIVSVMMEEQVPGKQKSRYFASSWMKQFNRAYNKCKHVLEVYKKDLMNFNEGEDIDGNAIEVFTALETKIRDARKETVFLRFVFALLFLNFLWFWSSLDLYVINVLLLVLTLVYLTCFYVQKGRIPASKVGLLNMTEGRYNHRFLIVRIVCLQALATVIRIYRFYYEDSGSFFY